MISYLKKTALTVLLTAGVLPASAAIVYVDLSSVNIPYDLEGVYLNGATGDAVLAFPDDFYEAPWVNLTLGGFVISNSDYLRPWTNQSTDYNGSTTGHYFANVAVNSTVGSSGVSGVLIGSFASGEAASAGHMGSEENQFDSLGIGYLAFEYDLTEGGVGYGWIRFAPNSGGAGSIMDMAFSTTAGESIVVGAVPEPATYAALAGVAALGIAALRRRRAA